jgi:hypothetical protein
MNGQIAQLVALASYANAYLRGLSAPFPPTHSTCKYCDRITFAEIGVTPFGKQRENVVADAPAAWFAYLERTGARDVQVVREPQDRPLISDRMSAGFAGGGGIWLLAVRHADVMNYWTSRWEVWNREAPEKRIWRVQYGLVGSSSDDESSGPDVAGAAAELEHALTRIHAFSVAHECDGFTECFVRALDSLRMPKPMSSYASNLFAPGAATQAGLALMEAAQSAWVFGGMGSWNDMGFDGADGVEYEATSDQLFNAINAAICAAANGR